MIFRMLIKTLHSQIIKDQEGERITSAATLTLARDTTDDYMFPTKGTKASISVRYAGPPLGGDVKLIKYSAGADRLLSAVLGCGFCS